MGWFEWEQTNMWDVITTLSYFAFATLIFGMATYVVGWLNQSCWALFWAYMVVESVGGRIFGYNTDDDDDDGPDGDGGEEIPVEKEQETHIRRAS